MNDSSNTSLKVPGVRTQFTFNRGVQSFTCTWSFSATSFAASEISRLKYLKTDCGITFSPYWGSEVRDESNKWVKYVRRLERVLHIIFRPRLNFPKHGIPAAYKAIDMKSNVGELIVIV